MDSRHDLGVDHARLLTGGYMDPQTTGQLRPPYGEICRAPGTDASTLSAYHSRYLASMPLSTGSSFPFLGGMFTGSLPGPPTSPFRTPSTPGVNNMRQFWPPTPPPDGGYGRYSMNANLFPLFGAPSPDSGAFLTQGLVSRLGSTTHLSPLIDHKEHSFFSHGIGLGSPLTPNSHVTSPSPFPHLIPSLERHPAYGGHMTLGNKELEDLQHEADDNRLMKGHYDCLVKHDIPSSRQDRPKSKNDGKYCCDKANDDCCKLSPSCIPHDNVKSHEDIRNNSKLDNKNHNRHPTNKVQPCKIEVSLSPALKRDLLSPPIESPKSDVASPTRNSKKSAHSPFMMDSMSHTPTSVSSYEESPQTRCSQCCASIKDVGIATKLNTTENKESGVVPMSTTVPIVPQKSHTPVNTLLPPVSITASIVNSDNSPETTVGNSEDKHSNDTTSSVSHVIPVTSVTDKSSLDQSVCKSIKNNSESPSSKLIISSAPKHVTAAVIPTAPKQTVHRDIHPESNYSNATQDHSKAVANTETLLKEQNTFCADNHIKMELIDSSVEKIQPQNNFPGSTNLSFPNRTLNKNLSTSCKVKDMIKNTCSAKQMPVERIQDISSLKHPELDCNKIPPNSPSPSTKLSTSSGVSVSVNPIVMSKNSCKNGKLQYVPLDNVRKCSPFREDVMKTENINSRLDCEFTQKTNANWTKATVSPFNWQANNTPDDQAINLTVSKKVVKPEPNETVTVAQTQDIQSNIKIATENTTASSGVIGVCHPNPTPIAMNKIKPAPAMSSISNFASISVLNQPTEQSTEVHILHRSSKSSFPMVNRNGTSPVPLKSTISHVTANTSIHRSLKTERMTKRGKISEMDKINHTGRTTLATLAPKLSKNVNFGKDGQTSHTISTSSSVSSTSIVFPATVNPCIPVGIAIAQQRQDSSTTALGKSQTSVPSSTPNILSSNTHIPANRVQAELQTQEILRDQKGQDMSMTNNPTPMESNLLVTQGNYQGPTIVSRQWESEALTRTALPSSWVAHGSIVAPAVWLGQGAYTATAAPASNPVPSVAMNSIESSPISLPPGGYQLARDSITGHLLLIPTANIELMDRTSVWPTFNSPAGNLPIQQLVTQQQHTQFEQVLPQTESLKPNDGMDGNCNITTCDISSNSAVKTEEKIEDVSGQVPSVPLASGQTYAFTTFPTQCDPAGFSYVLQSSTVMHLAHTQTTASIQTESGRRSQATSPLHCATPSPPPNTCSVQVSVSDEEESENESDVECSETSQAQLSTVSHSVTTAIQVDMDSQTNSEEDEEEERKIVPEEKPDVHKVEMSDSANQTESVPSESPKLEPDTEDLLDMQTEKTDIIEKQDNIPPSPPKVELEVATISIKEDIVPVVPGLEIVPSETELAPSLPVESKPVMDFIDHHGLNLLVDSIEEFASREQGVIQEGDKDERIAVVSNVEPIMEVKHVSDPIKAPDMLQTKETVNILPEKCFTPPYKTIDTTCTDGLGLLCALAEQRFFEEALNDDVKISSGANNTMNGLSFKEPSTNASNQSVKEDSFQSNSNESSSQSSVSSSPSHREATEMEMRLQIEELQKKYKQKQRELELLRNKREREEEEMLNSLATTKPKKMVAPMNSIIVSHPVSPVGFSTHSISSTIESNSSTDKPELPAIETSSNSHVEENNLIKNNLENVVDSSKTDIPVENVRQSNYSASSQSVDSSSNSSDSSSGFSERSSNLNDSLRSDKSNLAEQKCDTSNSDQDYDKNDKSKTPFFDETAWFVRRSERIFLSDARASSTSTCVNPSDKSNRRHSTHSSSKVSADIKEKKEHQHTVKVKKSGDDELKKSKTKISKIKSSTPRKRSLSLSSDSDSSSSDNESSEVENSDAASSTSENLPLISLVDQSSNKATLPDRQKRLSTDSEYSSGQSEDLPLSALLEQKVPELQSCILKPEDLQENARLLVLDEGLFYAGHITKSEDADMYGILIDGERAARPHMFSKEEILNAAVLEVKPSQKLQLPEGSRICAFWSQQYRCLYPGTVTKASSPPPDPSMLYVEFDDGDSGRIPLSDIRMLPADFPIVSMEPNPFMILGKRRSRVQSQNNSSINSDLKSGNESSTQKSDKDRSEHKKHKNLDKASKKSHGDGKMKDKLKSKSKSPSATNRSRSSSKSSISGQNDNRSQNSSISKEPTEVAKKKNTDKKPKDSIISNPEKSLIKPKKHKKHKDDHHKHHHHHHHKHHHHKKHKAERSLCDETVIHSNKMSGNKSSSNSLSSSKMRSTEQEYDMFILENSKTDLTVKIKKSPSPHTNHEEPSLSSKASGDKKKSIAELSSDSSSDEEIVSSEPPRKKVKKSKEQALKNKPTKRKDRVPSCEKSKIAAFLPVRQLWRWSGKSFKRPGAKGKGKKEFYRSIQRGKETIKVGDCAVFLSTGRPHLPYIGRIETMWESWGGKMDVKVKWFYHPEETKSGKSLSQLKGALFQSPHFDENDVQTISHKCEVLSWSEFQQKTSPESMEDNNDTYFLAGTYDPIMGTLILEPGVPNLMSNNSSDP